jgi:hypothetical protein
MPGRCVSGTQSHIPLSPWMLSWGRGLHIWEEGRVHLVLSTVNMSITFREYLTTCDSHLHPIQNSCLWLGDGRSQDPSEGPVATTESLLTSHLEGGVFCIYNIKTLNLKVSSHVTVAQCRTQHPSMTRRKNNNISWHSLSLPQLLASKAAQTADTKITCLCSERP